MSIESLSQWQTSISEEYTRNERGQAMAVTLGLVDLPFDVSYGNLSWSEFGSTHKANSKLSLVRFKEMVACVAMKLGPPTVIGESGSVSSEVPTLVATWSIPYPPDVWRFQGETIAVSVYIFSPSGCKIDPRTPHIRGQAATLHPECKDVLKALEEELA